MSTDERDGLCDSRGPRIGSEGRPLCGLPKYHQERHKPDPGAGWPETLTWSDVSFAGIPNVEHLSVRHVSADPTVANAVLRLLAEVYADHPDYRSEWRPGA